MIRRWFKKYGISVALHGDQNADRNIEGPEDYEIPSAEEAYEFQLQSELSSCEEE